MDIGQACLLLWLEGLSLLPCLSAKLPSVPEGNAMYSKLSIYRNILEKIIQNKEQSVPSSQVMQKHIKKKL